VYIFQFNTLARANFLKLRDSAFRQHWDSFRQEHVADKHTKRVDVSFIYDEIRVTLSQLKTLNNIGVKCPCNNFIKRHFNQYFVNNNNNNNNNNN